MKFNTQVHVEELPGYLEYEFRQEWEMTKHTVIVENDGTVKGVSSPVTQALGLRNKKRVSHIEPVNKKLRWLFYFLRDRYSDDSLVAKFTRKWPCLWQARIFGGPTLGPYFYRQSAIMAEVAWINFDLQRKEKNGKHHTRSSYIDEQAVVQNH